ncbi:MAG: RIP metalloprotease RseP [Acholeplasmataceae bacterium]|jgi:regulator of sigma E protease|nr:RIP metalloprotease RseP [Acholeplasmataceae bacterium]
MFLLNFIVFILVLGVIILIHEFGHFYFAKRAKILCHEFAIGMGPALWQKRKGETIYSIRSIPIGGFVSMAGEAVSDALIKVDQVIGVKLNQQGQVIEIHLVDKLNSDLMGIVRSYDLYGKDFDPLFIELDVNGTTHQLSVTRDAIYRLSDKREMWITPSEKSFESKTLWERFLVIFAGPFMNFVLAFFLFLIVGFFALKPNLDSSEISYVAENSPATILGLEPGDIITDINGNPITSWNDLSLVMSNADSVYATLSYTREGFTYDQRQAVLAVIIQTAGITNQTADGKRYSADPIIGQATGRAKASGGLASGDLITKLQQGTTSVDINSWDDIIQFFNEHNSGTITVTYERANETKTFTYELISERALSKLGYQAIVFQIGISPTSAFNLGYTLAYPFRSIGSNVMQVLNTLGLLFDRQENLGIGDLSGPVGIFSLVSQTTSQGFLSILSFTAFLSINIGLLNLMPIPALDGGRLVFLGIEAVTRKPLNRKLENTINNVMFFILIGLFIFVTYNDILRLIQG